MGGRRMLPRCQDPRKVGPTGESTRPPSVALMVPQHIVSTYTEPFATRAPRRYRRDRRRREGSRALSVLPSWTRTISCRNNLTEQPTQQTVRPTAARSPHSFVDTKVIAVRVCAWGCNMLREEVPSPRRNPEIIPKALHCDETSTSNTTTKTKSTRTCSCLQGYPSPFATSRYSTSSSRTASKIQEKGQPVSARRSKNVT